MENVKLLKYKFIRAAWDYHPVNETEVYISFRGFNARLQNTISRYTTFPDSAYY
jgi:hypothetical protein